MATTIDPRVTSRRRGLLAPFRRDRINDFASGEGAALIASNLQTLLGARCDSDYTQGEYPWRTDFGTLLHLLRHESGPEIVEELAFIYVTDAVGRWMTRIRVTRVEVIAPADGNAEAGVWFLRVWYVPRDSALRAGGELSADVTLPTSS